jgi:hypothetical protein
MSYINNKVSDAWRHVFLYRDIWLLLDYKRSQIALHNINHRQNPFKSTCILAEGFWNSLLHRKHGINDLCIHVTIPVTEMCTPNLSPYIFQIQWNFDFVIPDFTFFVSLCTFLNLNGLLCVCNFTFALNLHFIFLFLDIRIYLILHFVVQASQFIIQDNEAPSTLTVT